MNVKKINIAYQIHALEKETGLMIGVAIKEYRILGIIRGRISSRILQNLGHS